MGSIGGFLEIKFVKPIKFLSWTLPELGGMEAARTLKRLMPKVPVIMFTNFAKDQCLKKTLWAGIRQVVSKSDSLELIRALEAAGAA